MRNALSVQSLWGRWPLVLAAVALLALFAPPVGAQGSADIVMSQVYAGGGSSSTSASYKNDFVELFNRGTVAVDVANWALQYGSSTSTGTWSVGTLGTASVVIPAGGYILIKVGTAGTGGADLPNADLTVSNLNLSATSGKLALTTDGTALVGACPASTARKDTVGWGNTVVCYEGSPIPGSGSFGVANSFLRGGGGCTDTDDNSSDFTVGPTTVPRYSGTTPAPCGGPTVNGWLFWNNSSTGECAAWGLDGFSVVAAAALPTVAAPWAPQWAGDFDNDGDPDVLWRNLATGESAVWYLEDGALVSGAVLWTVDTAWVVAAVGDFDGNGYSDILWRKTSTGENALWLVAAGASVTPALLDPTATTWSVAGAGDLDGDGKDDLVWRDAAAGQNAAWIMNGATVASTGMLTDMASNWTLAGVGDIDGDGKDDLIWWDYNADPLVGAGWIMNGLSVGSTGALPQPDNTHWRIQDVQDFDGDGQADVFWRRPSDGENGSWQMDGLNAPTMGLLPLVPDGNWFVFNSGY